MKIQQTILDMSAFSDKLLQSHPEVSVYDQVSVPEVHPKSILVSNQLSAQDLVSLFVEKNAKHWVQHNVNWFESDLLATGQICTDPMSFFEKNFQLVQSECLGQLEIKINDLNDKPRMKQEVVKFVQQAQSQNVLESAEAIVEELYMNAIIDAPREAKQKGYASEAVKPAELCLYRGKDQLAITMVDHYGSLDCSKFIRRMNEVYTQGAGEVMNRGPGGAGLGCVIIFENCMALYLGVIAKKMTKVTCVIPVGFSNRQRDKVLKSLHKIEVSGK